jgi:RNA polymerase sigma-70 factor (ECF subfamily)
MPHERFVRRWFGSRRVSPADIDELLQEAYCRLAMLDGFDHIDNPRAYFLSIARNLMLRRLKRQQIVPIDLVADIGLVEDDGQPSLEDQVATRMAYDRVLRLIAGLPERCAQIVRLRKIEGWSQREIARHLGITEKAVEKQVWLGVKAVRLAWDQSGSATPLPAPAERTAGARRP